MSTVRIDAARLVRTLQELAEVGAFHDARQDLMGVRRLALTDADAAGRRRVVGWFREAGLEISVDRIGNVYGLRSGTEDLAPVLSGSHIDTVPSGGAYDGALGVLGALEVVRTLNDHGIATRRPLAIGFFTDEEGVRFGSDMLGSAVAVGRHALEHAYRLTDRDGLRLGDELERIGFRGGVEPTAMRPHAYVECHIEQGPVLAARGCDVGVVTGVQAITWYELRIVGRAAHAGTTPIEFRRDAGLAASRINVRLREMAESGDYGPGMRATMGVLSPRPGATNVVPAEVVATVDLRNPDDAAMTRAENGVLSALAEVEARDGVKIEARLTAKTAAVPFADRVQDLIEGHAAGLGLRHERILSGAGHDAQEWAAVCPAGMVFVPGEYDGISHNPREYSTPERCADGVNVLLQALLELTAEA